MLHLFLPLRPIHNRHVYCRLFTHVFILTHYSSFKLLLQLNIQYHGLYQVQILPAEPREIDTSEIDMALLQQIEKRMSFIISLTETNRSGILFLLQKNNAFCSSPYAMARSFLLVESSFLSKKDNRTFNEPWRCRYSTSSFRASEEVSSPYSIISLYCLISGICSGCMLLLSKGNPAYSFNRYCFVTFRGFSTE